MHAQTNLIPMFHPSTTMSSFINEQKSNRKKLEEAFLAVNLLERTCLNMIKAALEPKILLPKTNRFNGTVKGTIPEIFRYLYKAYGNITNFSLEATRQNLQAYAYNNDDPLDAPFSVIDDYADMSEAHGTPLSEETLKGLAEIILMKAKIFADNIQKWNAGTFTSWKDFQEYFIRAQEEYKEARPAQTASALGYTAPLAHVNLVTQAPSDALREAAAYIAELEAAQVAPAPPVTQVAAAVTPAPSSNDELLKKLISQMEDLQMEDLQLKVAHKKTKKQKDKDKNSKERLYCCSHGSCAHNGKDCNHSKEGHKKDATFSNMMGGSKKECYWIKDD